VLSGELFNGPARSSSPTRSESTGSEPDPGWHDDELVKEDDGYDSDAARRRAFERDLAEQNAPESIGMGTGRTGVKGVIRDRDEAEMRVKDKRGRDIEEMNAAMEKSHLGGRSYLEEEREKAARGEEGVDKFVLSELEAEKERKDMFGRKRDGRFGHLREVGVNGFVPAVEKEDRGMWVVVHLYEPVCSQALVASQANGIV
jgi:hypothetical protein